MNIDELLIEFDEMGFAPTTLCENPDEYACEWKNQLVDEIESLKEKESLTHFENISNDTIISNLKNELKQLKQQAVKEFAERLKDKFNGLGILLYDKTEDCHYYRSLGKEIDELLKEYEK